MEKHLWTPQKYNWRSGEYNINLLNIGNHSTRTGFVETMYTHSSFHSITKPTQAIYFTLIDKIFRSGILTEYDTTSGLFYTNNTDHFPISHIIFLSQVTKDKNRSLTGSSMGKICLSFSPDWHPWLEPYIAVKWYPRSIYIFSLYYYANQ